MDVIEAEIDVTPVVKRAKWKTLLALSLGYFVDQGEGQAMSIFSPVLRQIWGLSLRTFPGSHLSAVCFNPSVLLSGAIFPIAIPASRYFSGVQAFGVSGQFW